MASDFIGDQMFGAELIVETIIGDGGIINEGFGEEGRGLIPVSGLRQCTLS